VRGTLSNFLLFWVLFALAGRVSARWLRWCWLGLILTALSATQAHVLINGAYPLLGHVALALDGSFLSALGTDWRFIGLLLFNLVWCAVLLRVRGRSALASPSSRLFRAVLAVFVVFVVATGWVTPGISAHLYARNVVEHQFD